jgi:hypothetical protein
MSSRPPGLPSFYKVLTSVLIRWQDEKYHSCGGYRKSDILNSETEGHARYASRETVWRFNQGSQSGGKAKS